MGMRFWRKKPPSADRTPLAIEFPAASKQVRRAGAGTTWFADPLTASNRSSDKHLRVEDTKAREVIGVWEAAQHHELSRQRLHQFRQRDEMAELTEFDRDQLEMSADLTMRQHSGRLLLADWLAVANERREIQRERAERRAELAEYVKRRCPACGMFERTCICH